MSSIGRCRSCGQEIRWITTTKGSKMPCDTFEFPVIPKSNGKILAVTEDGEVFRGDTCAESYEAERWVYARISHFATCPYADEFRKRK